MRTRSNTGLETCKRAGVHDLYFHGLRHTFATWLLEAGVDYIVIEKLLGHKLPGTGDLYIHEWNWRLRDAVTKLQELTEVLLREEKPVQVPTCGATLRVRTIWKGCKSAENGAEGQNRTVDTSLFRADGK